ncbi:MAG: DUF559 domain-containing protein [Cyanobacteriota bacterium]
MKEKIPANFNCNKFSDIDKDVELLKKVRENFTDKELTLSVINHRIDKLCENLYSFLLSYEDLSLFKEILKFSASNNIDIIYKYSESPIELIFFNSIITHFLFPSTKDLLLIPPIPIFTLPIHDATKSIHEFVQGYKESVDICSRGNIYETISKVQLLADDGTISSDLMSSFEEYLLQHRLNDYRYKTYHFTIQASFPELKIDGKSIRADLLVWKPEDENFKLIVECDGFEYHSEKKSFVNDRKRDRLLKSNGYEVFRYSGTEIFNEPFKASMDLFNYLNAKEARK